MWSAVELSLRSQDTLMDGGTVMASDSPPPPEQSDRVYQVGCLLGCSSLILLFILIVMLSPIGPLFTEGRPEVEAPVPLQLPRIDPGTPVAGLLRGQSLPACFLMQIPVVS